MYLLAKLDNMQVEREQEIDRRPGSVNLSRGSHKPLNSIRNRPALPQLQLATSILDIHMDRRDPNHIQ